MNTNNLFFIFTVEMVGRKKIGKSQLDYYYCTLHFSIISCETSGYYESGRLHRRGLRQLVFFFLIRLFSSRLDIHRAIIMHIVELQYVYTHLGAHINRPPQQSNKNMNLL